MSKVLEMRAKRAEAWDRAKAFLDEHTDERGIVSAEDSAAYERMEQEVDALGRQVERLERQEQMDAVLNAQTRAPLSGRPGDEDGNGGTGRASNAYNQAFWASMRKRGGLDVENVLRIGADPDGGYLVPDEFERQILDALQEQNVLRPLCHVIKTESGDRKIPVVMTHGVAQWTDENEEYKESEDKFTQISLSAHKLTRLIKVSEELMQDSAFDMAAYIAGEFARSMGVAEEEAFLAGDGVGKPTGLLQDTGAEVGHETSSATAIGADDLIDLHYALRSPYRARAHYLMNDATIKAIRKLKDGNGQYLWQAALTAGTPDTILGRPVVVSPFMPMIGAGNKVIAFGDFSYYWIADRQNRVFRRLDELYATKGQVGFITSQRVDGRLTLTEAVKALRMKA